MNFHDIRYFAAFYIAVTMFPFAIPATHLALDLVTLLPRLIARFTADTAPAQVRSPKHNTASAAES